MASTRLRHSRARPDVAVVVRVGFWPWPASARVGDLGSGGGAGEHDYPSPCPVPCVSSHCPAQGTQQPAGLAEGSEVELPVAASQRDLVRREAGRWRPGGHVLAPRVAACVQPLPRPARLRTLLGPCSGHGGTRRGPAPYTCACMYMPCVAPGDSAGPCGQEEQCLHRREGSGPDRTGGAHRALWRVLGCLCLVPKPWAPQL